MVNKYDEKTKRRVINEYISGKSVSELKKQYHISNTAIYSWIKENKLNLVKNKEYTQNLENENIKLKEDIEVLKMAMKIISRK